MSRVVWKFVMDAPWAEFEVRAPKVVHVGLDPASANLAVWMEVDDGSPAECGDIHPRRIVRFQAVNTGGEVPFDWHHQGSVITPGGIVWHVYADRDLS